MGLKIWQFDSSSLNEFRHAEMHNGCFTSFLVKFHFSKAFKVFSSALNLCTLVWMPACPTGIGPWSVRAWIWLRRCLSNDGTMSSTMIQIPQHLERCNWADGHSINEDILLDCKLTCFILGGRCVGEGEGCGCCFFILFFFASLQFSFLEGCFFAFFACGIGVWHSQVRTLRRLHFRPWGWTGVGGFSARTFD